MQPALPRFELTCTSISGEPGFKSVPARAFASAPVYQVLAKGALAKFRNMPTELACASAPESASQVSGAQLARIVMGTPLLSVAPQMLAANWKALRRCWPRVVPVLLPTGVAGVGSLKPEFAESAFCMMMVAPARAYVEAAAATKSAKAAAKSLERVGLLITSS